MTTPLHSVATGLEFRLLGPLEVRRDGEQVHLAAAKQRALLAILLLNANEVVSSDRLVDALWGERPPNTAAKALQVYVSQLRKALAPDAGRNGALVTRPPGYSLEIAQDALDVLRFQRLCEEGRNALAQGRADTAAARLREALGLWRGPPLADLNFEPFAQPHIAQLEEQRLAAVEDRVDADLALGRHAALAGELEALVAQHPLRERLQGQLMLALYRSGRQADALAAFQHARTTLVDELGIEPGKQLRELERAVLAQDPCLDIAGPRTEAPAPEASRAVFVGRERELHTLRAELDAAIGGRGGVLLLVGEPGIGKSRLAEELARQARAARARVLVGRCWEAGGAPAYWPWVQSLRAYVEVADVQALRAQLGAGAADLAQLVPELRELFPDLPEPALEGEAARFRLFDSTARFLRSAALAQPLVLVLDDLHAADEPSLLMLRFVAGELAGARVLVVGTYRDVDPTVRDPLASTLAELVREQVTHRLDLRGLTTADVASYIELSAGRAPPAELVAAIHAETEGNPLFVGEVVRLLAAEGRLDEAEASRLWMFGIPQGVREVIGRRLQRLSPECTRVLTLSSVLGREFALDALVRVSGVPTDELFEVLDEATSARVLSPVPGSPGRLRFAHALIRETLYDNLSTPRRVQLHRQAGEALEALYADQPDPHLAELAYHFFEAAPGGDVEKALRYAEGAGDRALRLLAYEEAARHYELALQALEFGQPADPAARCELMLSFGDALAKGGNTPKAKETFLAAADLARAAGLRDHLARAALGYGGRFPWLRAGDDARLVPLLEEALAAIGDPETALRARLLARLAGALRDQPSLEPRSTLSRQAVAIARRLGDPQTLGYALVSLGTATWGPDMDEMAAIAAEVTRLAQDTGDPDLAYQAWWLRHIVEWTRGDTTKVAAAKGEHHAIADSLKQPSLQWYSAVMNAQWALFEGDFAEAERLADVALELGQRAQSWDAAFSRRLVHFMVRREQGRIDEVEEIVRQSVDEYTGYRLFRALVPVVEWELGRTEAARRAVVQLAEDEFAAFPRDGEWLFCLCLLAEVAAGVGEREAAAALYGLLLPYGAHNAPATAEVALGSVSRYLGLLATALGRLDDAERHFESALGMNERMGTRPFLAHTQHDYARMLLARGRRRDATRAKMLLSTALATYEELGMTAAAEKAALLAA